MFTAVVIGTDGSDSAATAVRRGTELARATGAKLHLVGVYAASRDGDPAAPDARLAGPAREEVLGRLEEAAAEIEKDGVAVATHAREGDPADTILALAEEQGADLIVVGNRGMSGVSRFKLGSVPNKVSHHAACDVWIVNTA
jgi:nucleotide-binding universal stress UspA family protein